jgi:hypothetical protein
MVAEVVVIDAMTGITVAAMAATITVVGSMTEAGAAITVATATITMAAAVMAAITVDRASPRRAGAIIDATEANS